MNKKLCEHNGWWFEIRFIFWHKKYLWCDKCLNPIPEKEVLKNADIFNRRGDGYFTTSHKIKK